MLRTFQKLLRFQPAGRFYNTHSNELQGTLHLRFLEHLKKSQPAVKHNLSSLTELLESKKTRPKSKGLREHCKEIDDMCMHNLHLKEKKEIASQLNLIIEVLPWCVPELRSYQESLNILIQNFDNNPRTKQFVKICFYLGLLKKRWPGPDMLTKLTRRHLDEALPTMSTMDLAIFCMACYKASVRTESEDFRKRLVKEITGMDQIDEFLYVVFIKSLRMNQFDPTEVLEKLREQAKAGVFDQVGLEALIHVFALLSSNGIVDTELSSYFIDLCINKIREDSRVKDIQKFLFSCALLNVTLKPDQLTKLESHLKVKLKQAEYEKWFDSFVDAILSLWMLGLKSKDVTDALTADRRFYAFGDKSRVKIDSRKKLLQTCIEIEKPEWLHPSLIKQPSFKANRAAPKYLITQELRDTLKDLRKDAIYVQQIQNLNIAGLLVKERDSRVFHLEILDSMNTLSDNETPNGILALKIRLLKHMKAEVRLKNQLSR